MALSTGDEEAGHEVVALVRNPEKAKHLMELGVSVAEGDITDKESLRAPMTGVDGMFHLAAWYKIGARDKRIAERINVEGTRNVLEVMKELGIKKGVYTSTIAISSDTQGKLVDESYRYNGPHLSEYDRTKWLAHYEVAEPMVKAGLPLVIVQPGVVYGPGDTSAMGEAFKQYLQRRLPMLPETYTAESLRVVAGVTYLATNEKAKRELGYAVRPLEEGLRDTLARMMAADSF